MKLETKLLRPIISAAAKLAAKRTTLPILNHLLLDGSNGALNVSATDIDLFHESIVEKKSGQLPPCCVPARPFAALVEGAGEVITLEGDKDKLIVSSDGWVRRMSTLPVAEFVPRPDVKGMKQLAVPAHLLADAIEAVSWAGDPDPEDKRFFKLLQIEMAAKSLKVAGSDGHKFARSSQKLICSDLTWALPIKAADLFCAAMRGEDVQLLHCEKRIVVVHSTGFFSCALSTEKWPDYAPILKVERIGIGSCAVGPLLACLERAVTVYPERFAPVTLKTGGGEWTISTDPGQDTYTETFKPTKTNTAKRSLRINASLLIDALKALKAEDVPQFSLNPEDVKNGGLFMETGDLLFLVARLNDKA